MTDMQDSLEITQTVDAPPEQVWRALTDATVLACWWWPERFRTTYDVNLREGGSYRFRSAEIPGMGVLSVTGTYREVRGTEHLVYVGMGEFGRAADAGGGRSRGPGWPDQDSIGTPGLCE